MGVNIEHETLDIFRRDWLMLSDFIDMWCDSVIGEGTMRRVYQFTLDKSLVLKLDTTNGNFPNVSEWEVWCELRGDKNISKYLAPCIQISNAGKCLLQKRTTPIKDPKLLPKKIPGFLADTKIQNWGMLKGVAVCHDYANHMLYKIGSNTSMIKADWWSDSVSAPIKYMRNQ